MHVGDKTPQNSMQTHTTSHSNMSTAVLHIQDNCTWEWSKDNLTKVAIEAAEVPVISSAHRGRHSVWSSLICFDKSSTRQQRETALHLRHASVEKHNKKREHAKVCSVKITVFWLASIVTSFNCCSTYRNVSKSHDLTKKILNLVSLLWYNRKVYINGTKELNLCSSQLTDSDIKMTIKSSKLPL